MSWNPFHHKRQDEYAPPQGPPPGRRNDNEYAPPPGPPPSYGHQQQGDYAPPPGPPPGGSSYNGQPQYQQQQQFEYAPPSGPPPPHSSAPHQQHDWQTAVPDTSLFPPPPPFFTSYERSPATNASEEEANAGEAWCERYPLARPLTLDYATLDALRTGNIRLIQPAGFHGRLSYLNPGHWGVSTARNTPDRCLIGYPPLYVVSEHDPLRHMRPKTIYYEVKLVQDSPELSVGIGFTALPYPSFRMPGWHRGSLAVHGDDGHKYVNNRWGGKELTAPFRRGDTHGVGMRFLVGGSSSGSRVTVFFTRNGRQEAEWDLHEEADSENDLPVTGLEGYHDLSCAIGTYDGVGLEVIFDPNRWMYRPNDV